MSAIVVRGDARRLPLPNASVDLIVTSPPYFALRSYTDTPQLCARCLELTGRGWEFPRASDESRDLRQAWPDWDAHVAAEHKAVHYAGQIGSEPTPAEYIAALVDCTREWVRVLKPEGSLFVDLGDSYATSQSSIRGGGRAGLNGDDGSRRRSGQNRSSTPNKSLRLLPERYRIACVDQLGLIARAVIIWQKPNGLPESVTDRVRRSHEDWVHLVKQPRYYAAVDEIRESYAPDTAARYATGYHFGANKRVANGQHANGAFRSMAAGDNGPTSTNPLGKLPGSVWTIPTEPLNVPDHLGIDHFAAFPSEWPRRLILGWSPPGVCVECGQGRRPVVASVGLNMDRPQARRAHELAERAGLTEAHFGALLSVGLSDTGRGAATQTGTGKNTPEVYALADKARSVLGGYAREYVQRRPVGFHYVCACPEPIAPTRPAIVLDPFSGTGTTAHVASALGRIGVGVDLSHDYCRPAAAPELRDTRLRKVLGYDKPAPVPEGQRSLFDQETAL